MCLAAIYRHLRPSQRCCSAQNQRYSEHSRSVKVSIALDSVVEGTLQQQNWKALSWIAGFFAINIIP
jgi:hypothetical protein